MTEPPTEPYDNTHDDRVLVFRGQDTQWRWHRTAPNNRIISTSGEGYHNYQDAVDAVLRANPGAIPDAENGLSFRVPAPPQRRQA